MTALVDPYAWPPHPLIARLRVERDAAQSQLAAVRAMAVAAGGGTGMVHAADLLTVVGEVES